MKKNVLKAMLVEADHTDADRLTRILLNLQPKLSFTVFDDGRAALAYLETADVRIDLFFIDRDLPNGINGLDIAERIRDKNEFLLTPLIFITAHETGLLDAFQEYHFYSSLTKPISPEAVKLSLGDLLVSLETDYSVPKPVKKILNLDTDRGIKTVSTERMLYIEVIGRDCYLYTARNTFVLPWQPLERVLRQIDDPYCVRCHKSFAVNLANVEEIRKVRRNIWMPIFNRQTEVHCEISKTYYRCVMQAYRDYLSVKE